MHRVEHQQITTIHTELQISFVFGQKEDEVYLGLFIINDKSWILSNTCGHFLRKGNGKGIE